ncbi:MAG: hypothetical protein V4691_04080 [Pseudomonadota bacterium]
MSNNVSSPNGAGGRNVGAKVANLLADFASSYAQAYMKSETLKVANFREQKLELDKKQLKSRQDTNAIQMKETAESLGARKTMNNRSNTVS